MKRVRARLVEWTPAALALFLATVATPRAGLFFHHHADGDDAHVHADGDEDHDHLAESYDDHHHHDHAVIGTGEEPEIDAPDHDETGHWHSQNRFHRALAPSLIAISSVQLIELVDSLPEYSASDRPTLPAHARGPPLAA